MLEQQLLQSALARSDPKVESVGLGLGLLGLGLGLGLLLRRLELLLESLLRLLLGLELELLRVRRWMRMRSSRSSMVGQLGR